MHSEPIELQFRLLECTLNLSQPKLPKSLGMSLGVVNFFTPQGFSEKAALTAALLKCKMHDYHFLKEIEAVSIESIEAEQVGFESNLTNVKEDISRG